ELSKMSLLALQDVHTHYGDAHDRPERRGLPRSVAPDERDHLARLESQRDALKDVGLAVVRVHVLQREQRHFTQLSPRDAQGPPLSSKVNALLPGRSAGRARC